MSGQKINDHGSWIGGGSKESPFPKGTKSKGYSEIEGAGHVGTEYPDTIEKLDRDIRAGVSKAKSRPVKPGYRN